MGSANPAGQLPLDSDVESRLQAGSDRGLKDVNAQSILRDDAKPYPGPRRIFRCPSGGSPPPGRPDCFLAFINHAAALPSASSSCPVDIVRLMLFLPSSICSSIGSAFFSASRYHI